MHNEAVKDTYRDNALSNKTPTPAKIMNMRNWIVGTPDQLFVRRS